MKVIAGLGAAAAAALIAAPTAHADANSYLAYLSAHGVQPNYFTNESNLVSGGLQACSKLHAGMSPEQAANMGILTGALGAPIVDAAQHELCPDTLH
jgi:Protein of unknown function (DUF732)